MWDHLRRALFPATCVGCRRAGTLLCRACAPPPADATSFRLGGLCVHACGNYGGPLRAAILRLKHGERAALDALAPLLANLAAEMSRGVAIVPVPTTWWRANRRGFDQSVALARAVTTLRGTAVMPVLRRTGRAQQGTGRERRLAAAAAYAVRRDRDLPGRVLLLDDVCTTGATLLGATAALRRAGVAVEAALVLARAVEPRPVRPVS